MHIQRIRWRSCRGKETDKFLYPKQKLTCDVAVNKKEKKYDIQRIENLKQSPTSVKEGTITIQNNLSSNDYKNIILKNESTKCVINRGKHQPELRQCQHQRNNINETINGLQTQTNDLQDEKHETQSQNRGRRMSNEEINIMNNDNQKYYIGEALSRENS